MIRRIYLDLDDVLNTLSMYFLYRVGCKISTTNYQEFPMSGRVDLFEVANKLLGDGFYTRESFWMWFDRQDWASVPVSDDCNWLIEQCERLAGRENVIIA